jgi:REG-2-like HAD superfamily hydrolase
MKLAYISLFLLNVGILAFRPHRGGTTSPMLRTSTQKMCVDRDVRAIPQSGVTERSDYDNQWRTTVDPNIVPVKREKFTIRPAVITFDAFGTLIEPSQSVGRWYREALNSLTEMTIRLPHPKYFGEAFDKTYQEKIKAEPCFGATTGKSSKQWWTEQIEDTLRNTEGLVYVEPEEITALLPALAEFLYTDVFSTKEGWQVKEDVMYTLDKLRDWRDQGNGPKIGVVSNFDERLPSILGELGVGEFLDFVTTSYSAKIEKPSKGIFDEALKAAGVSDPQVNNI